MWERLSFGEDSEPIVQLCAAQDGKLILFRGESGRVWFAGERPGAGEDGGWVSEPEVLPLPVSGGAAPVAEKKAKPAEEPADPHAGNPFGGGGGGGFAFGAPAGFGQPQFGGGFGGFGDARLAPQLGMAGSDAGDEDAPKDKEWKRVSVGDKIPAGWRLATLDDVREDYMAALSQLEEWDVAELGDGKMMGPSYHDSDEEDSDSGSSVVLDDDLMKIVAGNVEDVDVKLLVKDESVSAETLQAQTSKPAANLRVLCCAPTGAKGIAVWDNDNITVFGTAVSGEFGDDSSGDFQLPAPIVHVAMGAKHSCFVLEDGSVWCCGANDDGQCGEASSEGGAACKKVVLPVDSVDDAAVAVHCGDSHTVVRTVSGALFAFGSVCDGDSAIQIQLPDSARATAVSCGHSHTVVQTDSAIFGIGSDTMGQLSGVPGEDAHTKPLQMFAGCDVFRVGAFGNETWAACVESLQPALENALAFVGASGALTMHIPHRLITADTRGAEKGTDGPAWLVLDADGVEQQPCPAGVEWCCSEPRRDVIWILRQSEFFLVHPLLADREGETAAGAAAISVKAQPAIDFATRATTQQHLDLRAAAVWLVSELDCLALGRHGDLSSAKRKISQEDMAKAPLYNSIRNQNNLDNGRIMCQVNVRFRVKSDQDMLPKLITGLGLFGGSTHMVAGLTIECGGVKTKVAHKWVAGNAQRNGGDAPVEMMILDEPIPLQLDKPYTISGTIQHEGGRQAPYQHYNVSPKAQVTVDDLVFSWENNGNQGDWLCAGVAEVLIGTPSQKSGESPPVKLNSKLWQMTQPRCTVKRCMEMVRWSWDQTQSLSKQEACCLDMLAQALRLMGAAFQRALVDADEDETENDASLDLSFKLSTVNLLCDIVQSGSAQPKLCPTAASVVESSRNYWREICAQGFSEIEEAKALASMVLGQAFSPDVGLDQQLIADFIAITAERLLQGCDFLELFSGDSGDLNADQMIDRTLELSARGPTRPIRSAAGRLLSAAAASFALTVENCSVDDGDDDEKEPTPTNLRVEHDGVGKSVPFDTVFCTGPITDPAGNPGTLAFGLKVVAPHPDYNSEKIWSAKCAEDSSKRHDDEEGYRKLNFDDGDTAQVEVGLIRKQPEPLERVPVVGTPVLVSVRTYNHNGKGPFHEYRDMISIEPGGTPAKTNVPGDNLDALEEADCAAVKERAAALLERLVRGCVSATSQQMASVCTSAELAECVLLREAPVVLRYASMAFGDGGVAGGDASAGEEACDDLVAMLVECARVRKLLAVPEREYSCDTIQVESPHPYTEAEVFIQEARFGEAVEWCLVCLDPRSRTCQPEDRLLILDSHGHCCRVYAGTDDWDCAPLVVKGNAVIFELQTATDYIKADVERQHWGFAASCTGHSTIQPDLATTLLNDLESGLAFQVLERVTALINSNPSDSWLASQDAKARSMTEDVLFRSGLLLESDDADSPLQEFVMQFVNGADATPGGRLIKWLERESQPAEPEPEPDPEPEPETISETVPDVLKEGLFELVYNAEDSDSGREEIRAALFSEGHDRHGWTALMYCLVFEINRNGLSFDAVTLQALLAVEEPAVPPGADVPASLESASSATSSLSAGSAGSPHALELNARTRAAFSLPPAKLADKGWHGGSGAFSPVGTSFDTADTTSSLRGYGKSLELGSTALDLLNVLVEEAPDLATIKDMLIARGAVTGESLPPLSKFAIAALGGGATIPQFSFSPPKPTGKKGKAKHRTSKKRSPFQKSKPAPAVPALPIGSQAFGGAPGQAAWSFGGPSFQAVQQKSPPSASLFGVSATSDESDDPSPPPPPVLCPSGHNMVESSFSGGGYTGGYVCDKCGGKSNSGHRGGSRERWFCQTCSADYCFSCVPKRSQKGRKTKKATGAKKMSSEAATAAKEGKKEATPEAKSDATRKLFCAYLWQFGATADALVAASHLKFLGKGQAIPELLRQMLSAWKAVRDAIDAAAEARPNFPTMAWIGQVADRAEFLLRQTDSTRERDRDRHHTDGRWLASGDVPLTKAATVTSNSASPRFERSGSLGPEMTVAVTQAATLCHASSLAPAGHAAGDLSMGRTVSLSTAQLRAQLGSVPMSAAPEPSTSSTRDESSTPLAIEPSKGLKQLAKCGAPADAVSELFTRCLDFTTKGQESPGLLTRLATESTRVVSCRILGLRLLGKLFEAGKGSAGLLYDSTWCLARVLHLPSLASQHILSGVWASVEQLGQLRAEFHGALTFVAQLLVAHTESHTPDLSRHGALLRVALRCFRCQFTPEDHDFLERSQVLSAIGHIERAASRLVSDGPDRRHDEPEPELVQSALDDEPEPEQEDLGQQREQLMQSASSSTVVQLAECKKLEKDKDVIVTASSNAAMVPSLLDDSTETFWEPEGADFDGKLEVAMQPGSSDALQHIRVHVDNSRDADRKTKSISLKVACVGGPTVDVTVKIASLFGGWVKLDLPPVPPGVAPDTITYSVSLDGGGQDHNFGGQRLNPRLRGLKLFGPGVSCGDAEAVSIAKTSSDEAIDIFRSLTRAVIFDGKGLQQSDEDGAVADDGDGEDESAHELVRAGSANLREHVVGLLFSGTAASQKDGHQLPPLQKQVCALIFRELQSEAAAIRTRVQARQPAVNDSFCFELTSLVVALTGTSAGLAHLRGLSGTISAMCTILQMGSARLQRQALLVVRRTVLQGLRPSAVTKMLQPRMQFVRSDGFAGYLLALVAKSCAVQLKAPGAKLATLNSDIDGMRLEGKLEWDMGKEVLVTMEHCSAEWVEEIKSKCEASLSALVSLWAEQKASPQGDSELWWAVAALCILDADSAKLLSSGAATPATTPGSRVFCTNHDDGTTPAAFHCAECGPQVYLCAQCDHWLHLSKACRTHSRTMLKEQQASMTVTVGDGTARLKTPLGVLAVDRRNGKAVCELKMQQTVSSEAQCPSPYLSAPFVPMRPSSCWQFRARNAGTHSLLIFACRSLLRRSAATGLCSSGRHRLCM
eukprot:COSAG01_NODE_355_length_18359_cov_3.808773_3_plen_2980_part_00